MQLLNCMLVNYCDFNENRNMISFYIIELGEMVN